jgi:preprotein translocase subunit SecE
MSAPRRTGSKPRTGAATTMAPRSGVVPAEPTPSPRPQKPAVDKKPAAPAQPSVFATRIEAFRKLARDTWSEAKKVNWPDTETTRNLTLVVIGISIVLGLVLGGIDYLLVKLLNVF